MLKHFSLSLLAVATLFTCGLPASAGQRAESPSALRAGAARVDITPAADAALPMSGYASRTEGFTAVRDNLHARAIVLGDAGGPRAAIVALEIIGVHEAFWDRVTARLQRETGIAREHILLAAVHTHAAPTLAPTAGMSPEAARQRAEYSRTVEDAAVAAVRNAQAALQPARIGFGLGRAHVNTNRRARNGEGGWMLGNNPDGVSDKTVAVIRLDDLKGEPIAILTNYSVHATVLGAANRQISADLAGAASRAVERHYGDHVVAPWTSGAAGDQDPLYRVGTDFRNVTALGHILAEEVIRVADGITSSPRARIVGMQKVVSCPGKRTVQSPARDKPYTFEDADPVPIRLSLLVVNDIAIAGVSGEVLTNIGLRLKRESPFNRTVMVTHANGSNGYLPDDAAYEQVSYEITASRVKPGCAERAIVDGFLELMAGLF